MYNSHHNYLSVNVRDRTRYILFTSCWTVLFSLFYLALFLHSASTGSVLTSVLSHGVLYVLHLLSMSDSGANNYLACSSLGCSGLLLLRLSLRR